jgi:hypothetical protein
MAIKFLNSVNADSGVLYVNADNNRVGIGTVTPDDILHVNGNIRIDGGAGDGYIKDAAGNDRFYFTAGTYVNSNAGAPVVFQVAGSEKMRVASTGNVGIGTDSPGNTLDVIGNIRATTDIYLGDQIIHDGDTNTYLQFHAADQWRVVTGGTERLEVNNSQTTVQNVLIANDFVGIGTTNPSKKLDVRGEVALDIMPGFQQAGSIRIGRSDGTSRYHEIVAYNDSTAGYNYLRFEVHDGTVDSNVNTLELKGDGVVKLPQYGAGLLKTDASGNVSLDTTSYSTFSGDYDDLTNKPTIPVSGTDFDPVGTDNSTNVTLAGSYDYLTLSGQEITLGQIDYDTDITNLPTLGTAASSDATDFVAVTGDTMTGDLTVKASDLKFTDSSNNIRLQLGNITAASPYEALINTQNYHLVLQAVGTGQNDIKFRTGTSSGSDRMIIDQSGNVGIGNTSPGNKLRIDAAAGQATTLANSITNAAVYINSDTGNGSNNIRIGESGDGSYFLQVSNSAGTTPYAINLNPFGGNVGIGTATPVGVLNVNKEDDISSVVISRGGTDLSANTDIGLLSFKADYQGSPIDYASIKAYSNGLSGVRSSIDFNVKSSSGNILTAMTAYGSGTGARIGIGTTTPAYPLVVAGASHSYNVYPAGAGVDLYSTGNIAPHYQTNVDWYTGVPGSGTHRMRLDSSGNLGLGTSSPLSANGTNLHIQDSLVPRLVLDNTATNGKQYTLESGNTGSFLIYDSDGASTRFLINSSGNVGIGTSNPSYKLHVDGTLGVTGTGYVFTGGNNTNKALVSITSGAGIQKYKVLDNTNTTDCYAHIKIHRAYDYGENHQVTHEIIYQRRQTTKNFKFKNEGSVDLPAQEVWMEFYEQTDGHVEGWVVCEDYAQPALEIVQTGAVVEFSPSAGTPTGTLLKDTRTSTTSANWGSIQGSIYLDEQLRTDVILGRTYPFNSFLAFDDDQTANTNMTSLGSIGVINYLADTNNNTPSTDPAHQFFTGTTDIDTATALMTIRTDGNVGIGTTSPTSKLEIVGNIRVGDGTEDNYLSAFHNDGSNTLYRGYGVEFNRSAAYLRPTTDKNKTLNIGNDSRTWNELNFNASDYYFKEDATTHIAILSGGNVGIGTTAPSRKLHVAGQTSNVTLRIDTTGADPNLTFTTLSQQDWSLGVDFSDSGKLKIDTSTTVGAATVMTITSGGDVGIGTASPSQKLQVSGIAEVAGALRVTETGTAQHILIGNQDSTGTDKPAMIRGVNGSLHLGHGNSWSGEGGTMTYAISIDSGGVQFPQYGAGLLRTDASGYITADTNTYLTSYTETDTLDSVTDRGATTTNAISVGAVTLTEAPASNNGTFVKVYGDQHKRMYVATLDFNFTGAGTYNFNLVFPNSGSFHYDLTGVTGRNSGYRNFGTLKDSSYIYWETDEDFTHRAEGDVHLISNYGGGMYFSADTTAFATDGVTDSVQTGTSTWNYFVVRYSIYLPDSTTGNDGKWKLHLTTYGDTGSNAPQFVLA